MCVCVKPMFPEGSYGSKHTGFLSLVNRRPLDSKVQRLHLGPSAEENREREEKRTREEKKEAKKEEAL